MKKRLYSLSIIFLLSTLFMTAPAKADTIGPASNQGSSGSLPWWNNMLTWLGYQTATPTTNTSSPSGGGSTALPINNGVVFLMIAGVAIGVTKVKNNYKVVKA